MADNLLRIKFIADTKQLSNSLSSVSGKLDKFGSKISGIGKNLSTRLTLPLGIAGGAAIKMASDFEESLNKVNVAFGSASGEVREFAKTTLQQFGIAQGTALDMAALFGDMSTSMGLSVDSASDLSTKLVGLAGDLASFKNMNIEEVTTALAGVFTGETESLKRLGIVMTQVNLEQFAMEQGIKKTIKEMTQSEKVLLRYQFVMSKTANAQGDFARTSDGAANQMRIFQESMKELGAAFGQVILPAFTKLVKKANDILLKFKSLDSTTKKIIVVVSGLVAAIGPALIILGSMSSGIALVASGFATALPIIIKVVTAFKSLTVAMLANPIGAITAAVVTLVGGFVEYLHRLEPAVSRTKTFFNLLKSLGDPLKFTALQTADAAKALAQKKKQAEDAAKSNAELKTSLENLNKPLSTTINQTDELGRSLKKVKVNSQINLSIKKGDFDFKKGEFSKGDVAIGAEGFDIDSPKGENITKRLQSSFESLSKKSKEVSEEISVNFGQIGSTLAASLGEALVSGENVVGLIGATIFKTLGEILIQMGTAAIAASNLMSTFAIPGVGVVAGLAAIALGAGISALASKIQSEGVPAFANGGIVSGPTLGLMGEYAGARSNPEVIAPLDKLKGMIGQGSQNVNVGGEFRIQGQDLVVALQRAERNRSRIL